MSQTFDQIIGTVQTTNNTQTELVRYSDIPADSVVQVTVQVLALSTSDVRATWRLEASGGPLSSVLTLLGSISSQVDRDIGAVGWNATVDFDGGDVVVLVDGAASTTVDWMARIQIAIYTPGA